MKYIAFIRGINVGGNNIIGMADLKKAVEETGHSNVSTYIQSGNVIFESKEDGCEKIAKNLEEKILQSFKCTTRVTVLSEKALHQVVKEAPNEWKKDDVRKYVAFLISPVTVEEVVKEVKLHDGIDSLKVGKNVIYMSTLLSGITKSGFTKLAGKAVYKNLTIRNFNTVEKLLERVK